MNCSNVRGFDEGQPHPAPPRPHSSIRAETSLVSTFFMRPSVCFLKSRNRTSEKIKPTTTTSSTCRPWLWWLRQLQHIWLNSPSPTRRGPDLQGQLPAKAQQPLKKQYKSHYTPCSFQGKSGFVFLFVDECFSNEQVGSLANRKLLKWRCQTSGCGSGNRKLIVLICFPSSPLTAVTTSCFFSLFFFCIVTARSFSEGRENHRGKIFISGFHFSFGLVGIKQQWGHTKKIKKYLWARCSDYVTV